MRGGVMEQEGGCWPTTRAKGSDRGTLYKSGRLLVGGGGE